MGPHAPPASELDTFLLRDSKGNLIPLIGMSFEDFEKLKRIEKGLQPPPPPAYSFDSLTISGESSESAAQLQVSLSIRVREPGWVKIPLRLQPAALLEPAKYQGPGEHVLSAGGEGETGAGDGFVLWLKGEGKSHQLQLKLAVPLTEVGGERRLQLAVPPATESALRLQTPFPSVVANLRNGSEGILTTKSSGNQQTELQVLGISGDLQLAWQEGRAPRGARGALEASGEIFVRVESRSRVSAEARLKLRTLGKPIEAVSIRLPPGMQLVPAPATGYVVTSTDPAPQDGKNSPMDGKNAPGRVAEVQFDRPTAGPIDVRLLVEQDIPMGGEAAVRPGRFEVIGAQRQRGSIDFLVEGDWNLNWFDEASTRRVELTETPVTTGRPVARFEYFKQPLDLRLAITPRPTRVAVEPQHQVFVDATRLRLESTLRFRIRGPRATTANLDLAGWKIDRILGDNAAELPLPPTDGTTTLALPLTQIDPAKGELTFRFSGHLALPAESEQVRFSLPRAQVDITAPASLVVQPADNVELSPTPTELTGLVAEHFEGETKHEQRRQPPLAYRDLGTSEPVLFVGKREIRTRQVSAAANTLVKFRRQSIEVEQRLVYQVAYEPKRIYLLTAPKDINQLKNFQITLDGQLLEHRLLPSADESRQQIEALDSQDRLGSVELVIRYSLPKPALQGDKAIGELIPFVVPAAAEVDRVLGQTLRLESAEELNLKLDPTAESAVQLNPSGRGVLAGNSERLLESLLVNIGLLQTPEISRLVIDRMWIQSWLSPLQRQDRCVLLLRTAASVADIRLPAGTDESKVAVLIDGKSMPVTFTEVGDARVELGEQTMPQQRIIEIWYSMPSSPRDWGVTSRRLLPPRVQGAFAPQWVYWQVVLPSNEHLLVDPPSFAPAMKWTWKGYYFSRVADLNQRALEDWSRGSRQDPLPETLNHYLFANVGTEPILEVQTVPQRSLAGALAGFGLVVGLLILHVPQVRSTSGLLVLAALVIGLGIAVPQTALFAAQGVAAGLVIVALLAALRWLWTGQVASPAPIVHRTPSHVSSPRSTGHDGRTTGSRSGSAQPPTTAAVPVLPSTSHEVES
jgi:hypothetical protein